MLNNISARPMAFKGFKQTLVSSKSTQNMDLNELNLIKMRVGVGTIKNTGSRNTEGNTQLYIQTDPPAGRENSQFILAEYAQDGKLETLDIVTFEVARQTTTKEKYKITKTDFTNKKNIDLFNQVGEHLKQTSAEAIEKYPDRKIDEIEKFFMIFE